MVTLWTEVLIPLIINQALNNCYQLFVFVIIVMLQKNICAKSIEWHKITLLYMCVVIKCACCLFIIGVFYTSLCYWKCIYVKTIHYERAFRHRKYQNTRCCSCWVTTINSWRWHFIVFLCQQQWWHFISLSHVCSPRYRIAVLTLARFISYCPSYILLFWHQTCLHYARSIVLVHVCE